MTNPGDWTDRWFRRYESDVPVEVWRGTLRYACVRASAAWRPGKRELFKAFALRDLGPREASDSPEKTT